jgi:hypothetical protein
MTVYYNETDYYVRPGVPKMLFADLKWSETSSQGIRGYNSTLVTLKYTYFLIKGIMFC